MTDKEVTDEMIVKVEAIVREKVRDDFDVAKPNDRKSVAKAIIDELEKVMSNED